MMFAISGSVEPLSRAVITIELFLHIECGETPHPHAVKVEAASRRFRASI